MDITAQGINEALARGEHSASKYMREEIQAANQYLKNERSDKPAWLDDFLTNNQNKMRETIIRSSNGKGIASLDGYNEGYFNEIIQNANDIDTADEMYINVSKEGDVYTIECEYADKGFSVSNIYAFLNREMSDKTYDKGQSGKFGIGIKSFFTFVDRLTIDSNVVMTFNIISDNNGELDIDSDVKRNDHWRQGTTKLTLQFNGNKETSFNTAKLRKLIDFLCGDSNLNPEFLFHNEDHLSVIFDLRSLLFTDGMRNKTHAIKKIYFKGSKVENSLTLECNDDGQQEEYTTGWITKKSTVSLSIDGVPAIENKYLLFIKEDIVFAYPVNADELSMRNRFYATFFIKSDGKEAIYPSGALINTRFSNMHRTDLGHSFFEIENAVRTIKKEQMKLYKFMCSAEIENSAHKYEISDIFHGLLYIYRNFEVNEHTESLLSIPDIDTQYLPKFMDSLESRGKLVVKLKAVEEYQRRTPFEDESIITRLTDTFSTVAVKNEIVKYEDLISNDNCLSGVKRIYNYLYEASEGSNKLYLRNILCAFTGAAELIAYRITGLRSEDGENIQVEENEIDAWLLAHEEAEWDLLLKLIGRYKLNPNVSYTGEISGAAIVPFIFNDKLQQSGPEGPFSKRQNQEYELKYSSMKTELLAMRGIDSENSGNTFNIRYKGSNYSNWDGIHQCFYLRFPTRSVMDSKNLMLFVELLKKGSLNEKIGYRSNQPSPDIFLCEKKRIDLRYREKGLISNIIHEQQLIHLNFLRNIEVTTFDEFKYYREAFDSIDFKRGMHKYNVKCRIENITVKELSTEVLPWFGKLAYDISYCFKIASIADHPDINYSEKLKFIERITGLRLYISKFNSGRKKHVIGYLGGQNFKMKRSADEKFTPVGQFDEDSNKVYICYDNINDESKVISEVLVDLGFDSAIIAIFNAYISSENNDKVLGYNDYAKAVTSSAAPLKLNWRHSNDFDFPADRSFLYEDLYRLLTSRGSYDKFCPVCGKVPSEDEHRNNNDKKRPDRKLILFDNKCEENKCNLPFILTVACSACFNKLKNTLSRAELIKECDGTYYLKFSTEMGHGQHEKSSSEQKIELSPLNIEIINKYQLEFNRA